MSSKFITLQQNNKEIDYIIHLADIHIHKSERENEYRNVFNNLLIIIESKKLNNKNSVIVICGDVIHDKTELHPTSVQLTKDFFKLMASITDVICISGNHDMSLHNENDNSLFSTISDLKTDNYIYMLDEQKHYEYNNIIFGHTKFGKGQHVLKCDFKTKKIKCGLYHGTLVGAIDDRGYVYTNKNKKKETEYLNPNDFIKEYDLTCLGDIHKMNFIDKNIAYCGSLIQQDCLESLEKGFILWNIKKKIKGKFIRIHNDIAKIKVIIDEFGKSNLDISLLPKNVEINIECRSINQVHIDNVYEMLKDNDINILKKHDTFVYKDTSFDTKIDINGKTCDLVLLKSKDDIINLLLDKIKSDNEVDNPTVLNIEHIIHDVLKDFDMKGITKRYIKLHFFKFSNMGVYGEDNIINFDEFRDIVGIVANNNSGKSCFIDCILQAIFGEATRGSKIDMININSKSFHSEIVLSINDLVYRIVRKVNKNAKNKKSNAVKEECCIYENDINISGSTVTKTSQIIKTKIGCVKDFILSCIVTQKSIYQGDIINFAELTSKEKRDLLCKISNLDAYDYIYAKCSTGLTSMAQLYGKAEKALLTDYNEYGKTIDIIKNKLDELVTEQEEYNIRLKDIVSIKYKEKEIIQKNISECEFNIKIIDDKLKEYPDDKDNLISDIDTVNYTIKNIKNKIKQNDKTLKDCNKQKKKIKKQLLDIGDIDNLKKEYNEKNYKLIDILTDKIKENKKLLWYDYNIDYDKFDEKENNKMIKNNEKQKTEIMNNIEQFKLKEIELNNIIEKKIKIVSDEKYNLLINKQNEYNLNENKISDINDKIIELNNKYDELKDYEYDKHCKYCIKNNITKQKLFIENEIEQYNKNKNNIMIIQTELNKYIQKHKKIIDEKKEYDKLIKEKEDTINKINILKKDNEIKKMELDKVNDKIYKMKIMNDNHEKFKNNKNIEKEINEMENKINEIKCLVLKEEIEYTELTKTKNKLNDCVEDLEEKNKDYNIQLISYTEKKEYYENNINKINLQNTKQEYIKKYDDLQKQMNTLNDELKINVIDNDKIILLKQKQYLFDDLNKKCINLKQKKEYYNIIVNILKDNGIINTIMQKILLPKFENIVNNLFTKFNARPIKIEYVKSEIFITGSDGISVVKDGGYLSYLNNIVYRLGLAQLNGYMNTNFMIIDEAFDSADNTNKKNILNLIEYLKTINDWTIVISHDDIIKDKYDSMLYIKKTDDNKKQIVFSR